MIVTVHFLFSFSISWVALISLAKGVEGFSPHTVEPGTHLSKSLRIEMVDVARAARLGPHELRLLEHLQVLRDRRL